MTAILIAASKADGFAWWDSQPAPPSCTVITPRSPRGARGITADMVLVTPAMQGHPKLRELIAEAIPSVWASLP